ncbi:hypothetical protein LTSEJOH_1133 [Salmonella enterica subsp. enterica serovar Johannesburg str. S5-703]|nr:hypothetical protein LTSEJOH_1133 [Salmonella enterica subsp. enterica serovar Johannesburg str. S5-703]
MRDYARAVYINTNTIIYITRAGVGVASSLMYDGALSIRA